MASALTMTDNHRWMHGFDLDTVQHHTTLLSFPQCMHMLAFAPSAPSPLILGFTNNTLGLYDVETCQFPPWSPVLSKGFTHLHDAMLGVTLTPATQEENGVDEGGGSSQNVLALFWGSTWLCKEQFALPLKTTLKLLTQTQKPAHVRCVVHKDKVLDSNISLKTTTTTSPMAVTGKGC